MKRVTGIGGIFFKCKDKEKLNTWYKKHLGIEIQDSVWMFKWQNDTSSKDKCTVWSTFDDNSTYFLPSDKSFMINYLVENLTQLMELLRQEGVEVVKDIEEHDYGKFAWILDPEGNKIELWEPA